MLPPGNPFAAKRRRRVGAAAASAPGLAARSDRHSGFALFPGLQGIGNLGIEEGKSDELNKKGLNLEEFIGGDCTDRCKLSRDFLGINDS